MEYRPLGRTRPPLRLGSGWPCPGPTHVLDAATLDGIDEIALAADVSPGTRGWSATRSAAL